MSRGSPKRSPPNSPKRLELAYDPPDDIAIGIGRIITLWSFEVWLLQQISYAVAGVDEHVGRVAIRDPRPEEHVSMIEELMVLSGLTTTINLRQLRVELAELKTHRDNIAHNLFVRSGATGKTQLLLTSGKWEDSAKVGPELKGVNRRVAPEVRNITPAILEAIRSRIEDVARRTTGLLREVEAQLPTLPSKPPRRPVLDHPDDPS